MKKINVLATILAVAAGLTAGVAGYVVLNTRSDNTAVATVSREETVSEAASADTGEAAASGETKAAGESTAAGNAASPSDAAAAETAGEETVGAPDAATAAQTTSTGLDVNIAQAIHDAYVAKAPSAQGDVGRGYYIYDIDKDGIPELLLTYEEGTNRGLAVFTYVDGAVAECGVMWGFAHGLPFPASYPEGNGIVLEECARGYQCIWLISKDGTAMSDTINSDSANLFTEELRTAWPTYYTDIEDDFGYYYNHQYRAVLSPYFEESEALSLCDPADDTAIREALGMK
jgi:hypothetical protein